MTTMTLLGIFTKNIVKISGFYRDLFGFKELDHLGHFSRSRHWKDLARV